MQNELNDLLTKAKELLKEDGLKGTMEEYSNNKDNSIKEIIYSSANYNQIAIIDTTNWNINYENKPPIDPKINIGNHVWIGCNVKDYENGIKIKSRGYFMGGQMAISPMFLVVPIIFVSQESILLI